MFEIIDYKSLFNLKKVCVLIPTYNNAETLKNIIEEIQHYTSNIIIINDGSTDDSETILSAYPHLITLNYSQNVGKGWALRKGFELAIKHNYDYAITIDSDGQHFPSDLPLFLDKLNSISPCLIIGSRNMNQSTVPGKSNFGNKFSNFWFLVETGINLTDTQSGFRLYPVKELSSMKFFTKKYEFEIEVIVRAAWKGIHITSVPISVYYAPKEIRVSHFRPFKDFTRISLLNTVLVLIAILYVYPKKAIQSLFLKKTYLNIKDSLFNNSDSALIKSLSIGFGVFMGIVPIWGFQLIVGIFLAVLFKLNKGLFILSANISLPPMIPLIIFLSYKCGSVWMGDKAVHLHFDRNISIETIHLNIIQYLYGSMILAIIAGLVFGLMTYLYLSIKISK